VRRTPRANRCSCSAAARTSYRGRECAGRCALVHSSGHTVEPLPDSAVLVPSGPVRTGTPSARRSAWGSAGWVPVRHPGRTGHARTERRRLVRWRTCSSTSTSTDAPGSCDCVRPPSSGPGYRAACSSTATTLVLRVSLAPGRRARRSVPRAGPPSAPPPRRCRGRRPDGGAGPAARQAWCSTRGPHLERQVSWRNQLSRRGFRTNRISRGGGGPDQVKLPAAWLIEHSGFRRSRPGPEARSAVHQARALSNRGGGGKRPRPGRGCATACGRFGVNWCEPVLVGCSHGGRVA
jgi:hypothetical protein